MAEALRITTAYVDWLARRTPASRAELLFRERLVQSVALVKLYEDPELQELARQSVPVVELYAEAHDRCLHDGQPDRVMDDFLRLLLRWFKSSFFKWVNQLPCDRCGGATENSGMGEPTPSELQWGGHRIELHRCRSCNCVSRFPRYNNPRKLLETRRGRCGEWANCFTLLCRACGFDARYVHDWTDHVWTEVYSTFQKRWLHTDCCENAFDTPLMYESGWKKQLTYIIAFSRDETVDVIDRYTQQFDQVARRRVAVNERWLTVELARLTLAQTIAVERQTDVMTRRSTDLMLLMDYRKGRLRQSSTGDLQGRVSGSEEWRSARGEIGTRLAAPEVFPRATIAPKTIPDNWTLVRPGIFDLMTNGHAKLRQPLALQLTPCETDKCGSIFTRSTFDLMRGFLCQFEFELESQGDGADGFAFVFHQAPAGAAALGMPGFQLGYGGIPNSVAVEFDCFQNTEYANDPNGGHISIQTRWEKENSTHHDYSLGCCIDPTGEHRAQIPTNERFIVRIFYDATAKELSVSCDRVTANVNGTWIPRLVVPLSLRQLAIDTTQSSTRPTLVHIPDHLLTQALQAEKQRQLTSRAAEVIPPAATSPLLPVTGWHIGFTASTGGLCEAHVVRNFILYLPPPPATM